MNLDDPKVNKLKNLIKDSFRIRPNHDPIYIDVSGQLDRLKSEQHQVIFGRRGSGKSCMLVHFKNLKSTKDESITSYVDIDEYKRLGYPDIIIRLLLSILENMPSAKQKWRIGFLKSKVQKYIIELRNLLDQAESRKVKQEEGKSTDFAATGKGAVGQGSISRKHTFGKMSEFEESKLDNLERHLSDYKKAISEELKKSKFKKAFIIIDDFYLVKKDRQPDVIDYLHRLVRGTNFYLKIGTVKHRTTLVKNDGQTIGVVPGQDIEIISLDRTLEDLSSPTEYLSRILNSMGTKVGIENVVQDLFNSQSFEKLVISSGGVPRDLLNIFVGAVDIAIGNGRPTHITPTHVWKSASSLSYREKLINLRTDISSDAETVERVFRDLLNYCIKEKKRTCFLIAQEEAQQHPDSHELILQLMDGKLIHVVEPDTSAASGRKGRFEAYTLDFSLFMEPRKRGIEIVEFWNYDDGGRRIGVRESPVYSLARGKEVMENNDNQNTEELISSVQGIE
ncbi:hypothetical protein [Flavobacterium sp.]